MMAMTIVVMMLMTMNGFARFACHMLDTRFATAVAAIVHHIEARSCEEEERAEQKCQNRM